MGKHSTCLIIDNKQIYPTIHHNNTRFKIFSDEWGDEFSSYFGVRKDERLILENLTICSIVGETSHPNWNKSCILIKNNNDYAIIEKKGILIQGKNNNISFFKAIFK